MRHWITGEVDKDAKISLIGHSEGAVIAPRVAIDNYNKIIYTLFLDADIKNLSSDWIDKLVEALIQNNCDMSRGYYERQSRDAAVTKLIARPERILSRGIAL